MNYSIERKYIKKTVLYVCIYLKIEEGLDCCATLCIILLHYKWNIISTC